MQLNDADSTIYDMSPEGPLEPPIRNEASHPRPIPMTPKDCSAPPVTIGGAFLLALMIGNVLSNSRKMTFTGVANRNR
jgi:hypothetical protein